MQPFWKRFLRRTGNYFRQGFAGYIDLLKKEPVKIGLLTIASLGAIALAGVAVAFGGGPALLAVNLAFGYAAIPIIGPVMVALNDTVRESRIEEKSWPEVEPDTSKIGNRETRKIIEKELAIMRDNFKNYDKLTKEYVCGKITRLKELLADVDANKGKINKFATQLSIFNNRVAKYTYNYFSETALARGIKPVTGNNAPASTAAAPAAAPASRKASTNPNPADLPLRQTTASAPAAPPTHRQHHAASQRSAPPPPPPRTPAKQQFTIPDNGDVATTVGKIPTNQQFNKFTIDGCDDPTQAQEILEKLKKTHGDNIRVIFRSGNQEVLDLNTPPPSSSTRMDPR